jgi:hypothetical protein
MTPEELRTLVQSDTQATAAKNAGDWQAAAARCVAIAPKRVVSHLIAELGILAAYPNPADAITVLSTIDLVAGTNPVVALAKKWIQPGAPGIDIGDPRTRGMLTALTHQGGLGLSAELAAPLLALAERPAEITARDVRAAFGAQQLALLAGDLVRVRPPFAVAFPGTYPIDYIKPDGTCIIDGDREFAPEHLEAA